MNEQYIAFIEIALGEEYQGFWLPAGPGIYSTRMFVDQQNIEYSYGYGSFGYGDYKSTGNVTLNIGERKQYVTSVFIEDEFYYTTTSVQDMFSVPKSFYYDTVNQVLYLRVKNNKHPDTLSSGSLILGYTSRWSDKETVAMINGQPEYIPARIFKWGPLRRERDPLYFKTIVFDAADIEMFNEDGGMDSFHMNDYYGQTVYIKYGKENQTYENFDIIYAGNVGNINYTKEKMKIILDDPRKQLSRSLPANKLFPSEYSSIGSNEGIGKPLVYGDVTKAPTICLNEDDTDPSYYTFMVADTSVHPIQSIGTVYGNNNPISVHDRSVSNGTFRIARSTLESADLSTGDVFANVSGFVDDAGNPISNGLDIIKDMIVKFTPLTFSNSFFNVSEWNTSTSTAPELALSIIDEMEINDVIEKVSLSLYGYFIIEDDGRFTFRYSDTSKPAVKRIMPHEILEQPKFDYKQGEYASSVVVKYDINSETEKYRRVVENSNEAQIVLKYKQYKEEEFETWLKNRSDAISLSQKIASQYSEIKPQIEVVTGNQNFDLKIGDVVEVGLYYKETEFVYGDPSIPTERSILLYPVRCEVLGVTKDVQRGTTKINLWFIDSNGYDLRDTKMVRKTIPAVTYFIGSIPELFKTEYNPLAQYEYGDLVTMNTRMYVYTGGQ